MPLRKRPWSPPVLNNEHESLSINNGNDNATVPEDLLNFNVFTISNPSQQPRALPRSNNAEQPIITVSHSCLLIPVFVAAWWYWTKRKAREVMRELIHDSSHKHDSQNDIPDDFSTWDEVIEHESPDRSVHFVRWIKVNDSYSLARRRASVTQASRRTLRLLTSKSDLTSSSESFVDEEDPSVHSNTRETGWQCLEGAQGIELCAAGSGDYVEMVEVAGKACSP